MKKTKIQKLRFHKQKFLIKSVAWLTILSFLITLLFLGFPIVSDAEGNTIGDYFYCKDFLNYEDALSFNNDLYSVPDAIFDSPTFYGSKNDVFNYYEDIKNIFDLPMINGLDQSNGLTIYLTTNNEIALLLGGQSISLNYNSSYNYLTPPSIYGGSPYYVLYNNDSLGSPVYLEGGSYKNITNCSYIIYSSLNINMYYQNADRNLNYLKIQNKQGYGQGGFDVPNSSNDIVFPDGSGGTVDNNMYLKTADWKFNIPKYWGNVTSVYPQSQYTSNWGQGNIYFYCLTNDFQKANANDFYLDFTFHVWISGHHFSDTDSSVNDNFYGSFNYDYVDIQLSNVINGDNQVSFTVSDIFSHAANSSGQSVNDFITSNDIKNYRAIDKWNWYISCTAVLKSQSANNDSGSIVEQYNFISQVSKETGNTITDNSNPYYPDDMNPDDYPGSDSSSITTKDGYIVLTNNDNDNNNQVVNFNGNDKAVVDTLYDKLVPDTETNGGLTQRFLNLTNSNQWFEVMETALPILGNEFWGTVQTIFVTMLGIIGISFLLWILVHIL